ncbi:MAG: hypothetical protein IJ862_03725 [Selenomonadaceae bacterium]|nr:hypothetical protein [Selenomonadaceae bacterium]
MIKIPYHYNVSRWKWYVDYIMKKMCYPDTQKNPATDFFSRQTRKFLCQITKNADVMTDILLLPETELLKKYPRIKFYYHMSSRGNSKKFRRFNDEVKLWFNYEKINKMTRWKIFKLMDVKVCPYCNRQYIHIVEDSGYLGDIDHFLNKDIYPLFSLSIWNMIPCCKPCNQKYKRSSTTTILSPHDEGFDDDCIIKVKPHNVGALLGENNDMDLKWEIDINTPQEKSKKILENIKLFQLNEQYKNHIEDVKDILRWKRLYNHNYLKYLKKLLNINEHQFNRMIFGCTLKPDNFKDELLSKMVYDIVKHE